ncbi:MULTISPECIES: XrtA/PEP-CTERM system-associated ATPase [Thioalkalivibrio]|uniref:ATPase n=1 Tax=Thioalkalivibrio versutus TaxID=106634 RepID=A0A0G3FY39_9GAMM|nr:MULTISPECIES: XrtA/PEP-CTERM system-associated ATPase [Thioalkalivibrio]AKJ93900.1 ATPase [Thioalkalivibrio versutus]
MYEEFYGFTGRPFALSPDPRFFYASKGHSRAMAYLEYGVQLEEGFIVITGEVGAGKTTLVRSLFETLSDKPLVAAQLVSTQLDAEDLLRSVCLAFGLDDAPSHKAGQLRRLETFLRDTRARGQRALLVVDEAQNLGPDAVEELRMLSNFQGEDGPLLQSFLLGQPEFRRLLRSEDMQQLRQRVIATYHLGPMDADDTRAYVEHRLARVGWNERPHFDDDIWARIHDYTSGIPRKVNTFCDRLLLMGYLEECTDLDAARAQQVIDEIEEDLEGVLLDEGPSATGRPEAGSGSDGLDDRLVASQVSMLRIEQDIEALEERLQRIERNLLVNFRATQEVLKIVRDEGYETEALAPVSSAAQS